MLLRAIIIALKKKFKDKENTIAVTASTGKAASTIGGKNWDAVYHACAYDPCIGLTVNSWGCIKPNNHNVDEAVEWIYKCKGAKKRWKDARVLIIDESEWNGKGQFTC